jgi:hypothetical protein
MSFFLLSTYLLKLLLGILNNDPVPVTHGPQRGSVWRNPQVSSLYFFPRRPDRELLKTRANETRILEKLARSEKTTTIDKIQIYETKLQIMFISVIPPSTSKNPVLLNVEDVFGDEVHELSLV